MTNKTLFFTLFFVAIIGVLCRPTAYADRTPAFTHRPVFGATFSLLLVAAATVMDRRRAVYPALPYIGAVRKGRAHRNQYVIGCEAPDSQQPTKWHKIHVKLNQREAGFYARYSYYTRGRI